MEELGLDPIDVKAEAWEAWNDAIQRRMPGTVWNSGGCASWYLDAKGRNVTIWPDFSWRFRAHTRLFDIAAYEVRRRVDVTFRRALLVRTALSSSA